MPLLLAILGGVLDFGWYFAQTLDLRGAAAEGARLAIVNESGCAATDSASTCRGKLVARIKSRVTTMNAGQVEVYVALVNQNANTSAGDAGDEVVVCLRFPGGSLSGLTDALLPSYIASKAVMRMEQDAKFDSGSGGSAWSGAPCTV